MILLDTIVLIDRVRSFVFAALQRPRMIFCEPTTWVDHKGAEWMVGAVGEARLALTWINAGWFFDAASQSEREEEIESVYQQIKRASPRRQHDRLKTALDLLCRGRHIERVLWGVHLAVRQSQTASLILPLEWLGARVYGGDRRLWPKHWGSDLIRTLKGLSRVHLAGDGSPVPEFGIGTALLNSVADLRDSESDSCGACCGWYPMRHRHVKVQIGPAFLGILEEFATCDAHSGTKSYSFPLGGPRSRATSLWQIGSSGRVVSVFLPAKLGEPSRCSAFTRPQHRLLEAVVRETTRAKRKDRTTGFDAEVIVGNNIPVFHGKRHQSCELLDSDESYVGFNGNGLPSRKGRGYRLSTTGGWLAKAGYGPECVIAFLDDLAVLSGPLGMISVGVDRNSRMVDAGEMVRMAVTQSGRANLSRMHLRIYTRYDYLDRWRSYFSPEAAVEDSARRSMTDVADLLVNMKRKSISRRMLAAKIEMDHSFLSKILNGTKPWPEGRFEQARAFVDEYRGKGKAALPNAGEVRAGCNHHCEVARAILERGWSVVPQLRGEKQPRIRWKAYQERLPTIDEINEWYEKWPNAGFALVLGAVSDVFVVDVDGPEAHDALVHHLGEEPLAVKAITGSGKPQRYHLFFRHPDIATRAKQTPWHPNLEFRGKGGIVIIPPSEHKSGNRYSWVEGRSPDDMELTDLPKRIVDSLKPSAPPMRPSRDVTTAIGNLESGIAASPRTLEFLRGTCSEGPNWNDRLFRAACDLRGRGMTIDAAMPLLIRGAAPWNRGEEEFARRTIESAYAQPREPGRL